MSDDCFKISTNKSNGSCFFLDVQRGEGCFTVSANRGEEKETTTPEYPKIEEKSIVTIIALHATSVNTLYIVATLSSDAFDDGVYLAELNYISMPDNNGILSIGNINRKIKLADDITGVVRLVGHSNYLSGALAIVTAYKGIHFFETVTLSYTGSISGSYGGFISDGKFSKGETYDKGIITECLCEDSVEPITLGCDEEDIPQTPYKFLKVYDKYGGISESEQTGYVYRIYNGYTGIGYMLESREEEDVGLVSLGWGVSVSLKLACVNIGGEVKNILTIYRTPHGKVGLKTCYYSHKGEITKNHGSYYNYPSNLTYYDGITGFQSVDNSIVFIKEDGSVVNTGKKQDYTIVSASYLTAEGNKIRQLTI